MYFNKTRMREIKVEKELVDVNLLDKDRLRPKKFVCRNANPDSYRIYQSWLYKKNLDPEGYISFLNRYFTPGSYNIEDSQKMKTKKL